MSEDWRNETATEQQKEKLRFFGCTWDDGITAGQASDALEECAKQFPNAEADYQKSQPATEMQKEKLRFFGCTWNGDITVCKASDALEECARQFPDRESIWQLRKRKWVESPGTFPIKEFDQLYKASSQEVTIQKAEAVASQLAAEEILTLPTGHWFPREPKPSDPKYQAWIDPAGKEYGFALDHIRWRESVKQIKAEIEAKSVNEAEENRRNSDIEEFHKQAIKQRNESPREVTIQKAEFDAPSVSEKWTAELEVTIQEAAKRQTPSPQSNIIPAREVQEYARQKAQKKVKGNKLADAPIEEFSHDRYSAPNHPTVRKPTAYKARTPIERFSQWTEGFLERNQTCIGGHWLPVGPLNYVFASEAISIGLCRQMADTIESKGYCVEPDARFGSGTCDRNQTFAFFKPLDGEPIQPSGAYLGAANLLRLCVLITTADGKIDLVELDVFRRAIENQPGLTLTDHKRLLILEQLLVQELCSASKTAAKIAKSIPREKRFVVGKLLVEVAAANGFITDGERRVLNKIFKSLEIPPETLESLIDRVCPSQWPHRDSIESDVSKNDRWLWNHWRTGHPGVIIDSTTLAGKRWNFNDWKALNARWQDLHEWLVARQKNYRPTPSAIGEKIQKAVVAPAPKDFTLDMARVYEITSETKEVVAILSVLMEDEPEKPIAPAVTITLPAPEIPKVSGEGKAALQSTRFHGLDVAFHPILERLLTRDSWPKDDFKSLADEFHFMPSKIHDTLNEWADEVLGDFILDGEDPVIIRRELITKETIYG